MEKKIDDNKEYLKNIILRFFKKKKSVPSIGWTYKAIGEKRNITLNEINVLYAQLLADGFLLLKKNDIVLNPNKNYATKNLDSDVVTGIIHKRKDKKKEKEFVQENEPIRKKQAWWRYVFIFILSLIGIGAAYMSIDYSYVWLLDFLTPFKAALLATIMVLFAISSFDLIILFKQKKKYLFFIVFIFLWIIVTFFSMVSTVAGQYNVRMEDLQKRYKIENRANYAEQKRLEYMNRKIDLREKLSALKNDNKYYQGLLFQYDSPEKIQQHKKMYNYLQKHARQTRWRINKTMTRINAVENNDKYIGNKKPVDFYVWMSLLTELTPEMIQFLLSVFPAIFIDLIAPLSFAVVMFVRF
jgi:hypothetical protein